MADAVNEEVRIKNLNALTKLKNLIAGSFFVVDGVSGNCTNNNGDPIIVNDSTVKMNAEVLLNIVNDITAPFDPDVPCVVGKTYYDENGKLYECVTAHSGAWNPDHFEETSVENVFAKAKVVEALKPYLTKFIHNLARTETNGYLAVDSSTNGPGKLHTEQVSSFKETDLTDCNNILVNGIFNVETTFSNVPTGMVRNGLLLCFSSGVYRKLQIIAEYPITANINKRLWVRIYNHELGWTDWENLTTKQYVDDFFAKSLFRQSLSANTDFNGVEDGFYYVDTTYTYTNLPITKGFVFSFSSGNYAQQIAIDYFLPTTIYCRKKISVSAWSAWEKVDNEQIFKGKLLEALNSAFEDGKLVCNLFNGVYVAGVSIDSLSSTTFQIIANDDFNSLAVVPIKPNTTYTLVVEDKGAESNNYYYFKACTLQSELGDYKEVIGKANTFKFSKASQVYTKLMEVTTGDSDKYLLVQASKTKQPYLEILEGSFSDFVFSDYTNAFKFISNGSEAGKDCRISYVSSNTYNIKFGDYSMSLFRTIDNDRSCDNWNIGTVKKGGDTLCPTGTDILGPLRVNGEGDFIGGVHKYEITDFIQVVCDGELVTLNSSLSKDCNNISILLKSRCFTRTDATYCFDRFVSIEIEKNKIHASNTFKCVSSVTLTRATNGGLFAVSNSILINASLNNYIIEEPPTETISNKSKINVLGVLNTTLGSVSIKNVLGREQEHYRGFFTVFTNESPIRTKIYMDVYNSTGTTLNVGDEVAGEFEYTFS